MENFKEQTEEFKDTQAYQDIKGVHDGMDDVKKDIRGVFLRPDAARGGSEVAPRCACSQLARAAQGLNKKDR